MGEIGSVRATLGGKPLLGSQPIIWELREGTSPVVRDFPIRSEDKEFFRDPNNILTRLIIQSEGEDEDVVIRNLFVVDVQPGPNPFIDFVRVADRRIWWPYTHVVRRYNIRRKVGVFRPISPNAEVVTPVADDISYWPWSLRDELNGESGRWKISEMIPDMFVSIRDKERELGLRVDTTLNIEGLPDALDEIPVENLEIDDSGDSAVGRLLDHLPGVSLFVDFNGHVIFFDKANGREATLLAGRREIVDRGHVGFVRKRFTRPRAVRCWFTIEAEMRMDYVERSQPGGDDAQTTKDPTEEDKEKSRLLENVMPLPDFSLNQTIDGNRVTHHQGTWLEIEDLLSDWNALAGDEKFPPQGTALTLDKMRQAMMPYIDLANIIPPRQANASLHMARVGALIENYRRTFRIPARWMNRFLSIRAYRVATIDVATGTRAPAICYCDYTYLRQQAVVIDSIGEANATEAEYAQTVRGYPTESGFLDELFKTRKIDSTALTPGKVTISDQDQGILQIDLINSPSRHFAAVIPGFMEDGRNVRLDIRKTGITPIAQPIFFNASVLSGRLPRLEADWKLAVIFTAIPSSPNNINQLYPITIENDNQALIDALPINVRPHVRQADGPVLDVRIPPSLETARVHWNDEDAAIIVNGIFGVNAERLPLPRPGRQVAHLVTNQRFRPEQGAIGHHRFNELEAIALAEAVRVYTERKDRFEGAREMALRDASLTIDGNMESLRLTLYPNGELTVNVTLPTEGPKVSMLRFLDDGVRRLINRVAKDPAAI